MEGAARTVQDTDIGEVLELARAHLGMDVAFVGQVTDGASRLSPVVAADATEAASLEGACTPYEDSYCARIIDGRIGAVTPDTSTVWDLTQLEVTEAADIRAYLGVPVHNPDGSVYGTVCAWNHEVSPHLGERDADVLRFVADVVEQQLAADEAAAAPGLAMARAVQDLLDADLPDVVLQPIVRLATDEVIGFEALARFPAGPPDVTFEQAHAVGLGVDLELQAARNALRLLPLVRSDLTVSVNIGLRALVDERFPALLDGVDASRVRWELTEHEVEVAADVDRVTARLAMLRSAGCDIAMDDVGSGYAGLDRLLRLEPATIKIDRALVSGIDVDMARRAMLGATHSFARQVGAVVIAEGIETETERQAVHLLGIDYGQGWELGRPAAVELLDPSLRATS